MDIHKNDNNDKKDKNVKKRQERQERQERSERQERQKQRQEVQDRLSDFLTLSQSVRTLQFSTLVEPYIGNVS